jgi:hypothetical protein
MLNVGYDHADLIDAMDTFKAFKRGLNNSDNYHRRGFGNTNAKDGLKQRFHLLEIPDKN